MYLQVDKEPYRSILAMLRCYPNGLELKHLSYELVEETLKRKGKTSKNNKPLILKEGEVKKYLKEKKEKSCYYKDKINPGCIKTRQHLYGSLKILLEHGLIQKGWTKYFLKPIFDDRLIMNYDLDTIGMYHSTVFAVPSLVSTENINIYNTSLAMTYQNEDVRKTVDSYINKINSLVMELCEYTNKVQKEIDTHYIEEMKPQLNAKEYEIDRKDEVKTFDDKETLNKLKETLMKQIAELEKRIKKGYGTPNLTMVIHARGTKKIENVGFSP